MGIVALAGGAIFAATRPTWHPTPGEPTPGATRSSAQTAGALATVRAPHASPQAGVSSAAHSHAGLLGTGRALAAIPAHPEGHSGSHAHTSSITYTVKSGDTLSGIAEWFRLHGYGGLYHANQMVIGSNPNLIIPGERITISDGAMTLHHSAGA